MTGLHRTKKKQKEEQEKEKNKTKKKTQHNSKEDRSKVPKNIKKHVVWFLVVADT